MAYDGSLYLECVLCTEQGAHSPDARSVAMGVYPVQAIKSQILESDEVSEDLKERTWSLILRNKLLFNTWNYLLISWTSFVDLLRIDKLLLSDF